MPHPERAMEFTNLYDWPLLREQMKRAGCRACGVDEHAVVPEYCG